MRYIVINEGVEKLTQDFLDVKKTLKENISSEKKLSEKESINLEKLIEKHKEDLNYLNSLSTKTIIGKIDKMGQISYI